MIRPEKSKQTFITSTVKLALDKDKILKTLHRCIRVELKVVTYIWKNILMSERKTEMEKKDCNERWKKSEKKI